MASLETSSVTSLTGFVDVVSRIARRRKKDLLVYRGHKLRSYEAVPSVFREDGWIENEDRMLRALLASHPNEFERDLTTFERLVRAQHYGLPTRLLDVTKNPLVALYFACESAPKEDGEVVIFSPNFDQQKFSDSDTVACISNLSLLNFKKKNEIRKHFLDRREVLGMEIPDNEKRFNAFLRKEFNENQEVVRLSQLVEIERPGFKPRINPMDLCNILYVEPRKLHKRLQAQDGAFLLFGLFSSAKEKSFQEDIEVSEIHISKKRKPEIRRELAKVGISDETLFPEIDRSADHIKKKYCQV